MEFTHNNQTYKLLILHLAGSKLYGNSTPQSDTDYRGIFLAPPETKIGLIGKVEQLEGKELYKSLKKAGLDLVETDDCQIWELNRFASLASDGNPNVLDTISFDYNNPEFTVYINEKGKELIDNKRLFLSSRLKFTFSGYAISQLTKIRNRDKYLTKYPRVSEVLDFIKTQYGKTIDWDWVCNNFGGPVAEYVSDGETAQNHWTISKVNYPTWDSFKIESGIEELDKYRVPRLIDYCNAKDMKGGKIYLESFKYDPERYYADNIKEDKCLKDFLYDSASFRTFSPSMLAIYTDGTGIFTTEGKLKANDPEIIGEFVCLLSIDQMNYKAEKDFNTAMWEWKCKRNESRSAMEAEFGVDLKNLSHLWRLMTKAKEILTTGDYNPTLYGEELKTLRGIRDGSLYGKDSYDFAIKFAEENDNELNELYKTTKLPKKADMVGINNLVLKLQGI